MAACSYHPDREATDFAIDRRDRIRRLCPVCAERLRMLNDRKKPVELTNKGAVKMYRIACLVAGLGSSVFCHYKGCHA